MQKASHLIVEPTYTGVKGVTRYRRMDDGGKPIEGPTVAVVGMVHGNEPVGGQLLKLLSERVEGLLLCGEVIAVRANLQAEDAGHRHTPAGEDLNRLWDGASIERIKSLQPELRNSEESRVLELVPVISGADVIMDFHSTTRPTHPFLVFRDDQHHVLLGQVLGVERMVTGLHKGELLGGGMCPDIGLYPHENTTRLGFTYEAGQHQDPTNLSRAYQVLTRLLFAYGMWGEQPEMLPENFSHQVYEVMDRFRQVSSSSDQWRFVGYEDGEGGGSRVGPPRTLASFEAVEPGEIVMRRGRRVISRAHSGFTMLLPNPNAGAHTDLYYLAQRRLGGIVDGAHVRTNETALQEAEAVEKMLDTLDDDAFDRGMTLASFDSRQVLDQCADLAARTLRLPVGHPNRKVAVLGRGDWGTGEAARRVGRRYKAVMRSLLRQGVPIDRYQVLRGASLGWLNALTSANMAGLLAEGQKNSPNAEASKLFLSDRQPHTLSLLVVGDIDRALALGDLRGVRVALLVEASTAEPNGDNVKVRVARMALFSSRPEILKMVSNLLASFRDQHEALGRQGYLKGDETLEDSQRWQAPIALYAADGNSELVRRKVIELQIERWKKQLSNREDLGTLSGGKGMVLAMQMAQTGILDSETLSLLLKQGPEGGAVFDLDELNRVAEIAMKEAPPSRQRDEFHEPV